MFKIIAVGCALAGCVPVANSTAPESTAPAARPKCAGQVVTIQASDQGPMTCDVVPPQRLDVVYDAAWWESSDWGSDTSLASAATHCDNSGGTQHWDNGTVLVCQGVDY